MRGFNILNYFLWVLIAILSSTSVAAQTAKAYEEAGDDAFKRKDYNAALEYFLEAANMNKENTDLSWKIAETARIYNSYVLAEKNYQKIITAKLQKTYPSARYYHALMQKYQGKYAEAKDGFEDVLSDPQTPYDFFSSAKKEIKSCESALSISEAPKDVTITHLGKNVNTPYSEFGATEKNGMLYYSSLRFENKEDKRNPPRLLTKVLSTQDTTQASKTLKKFNEESQHTAYTSFSPLTNRVYFTVCDYVGNGDEIVCNIYYREKQGDSWGKAERLPDFINFPGASNTMPSVSIENKQEVLYFTSNRKDGKGGYDIWTSTVLPTGGYSYPLNLAFANTRADELSPYYHSANKTLYFSSDGYDGLGGYDVFSAVKNGNSFTTPRNMGKPINSSYNDLYFNILEDGTTAYLSSNRVGSLYLDKKNETCCYDIYKVKMSKKILETPKEDKKEEKKKDKTVVDTPTKDLPKEANNTTPSKPTKNNTDPTKPLVTTNVPQKDKPSTNTTTPPKDKSTPSTPIFNIPTNIPKEYATLEEFLPLPLYFDNDEPDRNTRAITTNKTYEQAENTYYKRKYEYLEKNLLKSNNRSATVAVVDEFFEKTINGNFVLLQKFTPILLARLYKGEKIEIIVKGYASPLAKNDYNNNLGKRRVTSLINFWRNYEGGIFKKYFDNGQLKITQVSFGEDTAASGVSDNQYDEAASIYSINAAQERRIEIIEIKKN